MRPDVFIEDLAQHLRQDAQRLFSILELAGQWQPDQDHKLAELHKLLTRKHPNQKVLIFSQFADTVSYLADQLQARGLKQLAGVTGDTEEPSHYACRFSPDSNKARDKGSQAYVSPTEELRVLVATDVLSEGQNLQDAAIVVNFDLPWAIIRLIQRAGRVDRIGQKAEEILCYSFVPAEGVERIIRLRSRVRQRLHENAEVVGTDETFFEDEKNDTVIRDLFTEKSGILDDPADDEVDLASLAYQIWKNACDTDPSLKKTIPISRCCLFHQGLVRHSRQTRCRGWPASPPPASWFMSAPPMATTHWHGWTKRAAPSPKVSTKSCAPPHANRPQPTLPRLPNHHPLVKNAVGGIQTEHITTGGQLGKPSSARRRVYDRLKDYAAQVKDSLFDIKPLHQAIDAIYDNP